MAQEAKPAPGAVPTLSNPNAAAKSSDVELLRQFLSRTGEQAEAAFATLVERHGPMVDRVCRDILGNRHEAQDVAQAVFLVLARKARSVRKPESLGPWLHGVSLRVARRARSDAARQKVAERRKAEIMRLSDHTECRSEPMDYSELHEEIDRLPAKYRQPIILCYMQGRTQPQAAQLLGWPLGTVQIRLHRGRERLRSRLTRARASLIAANGCELTTAIPLATSVPRPDWTETTARAAVRFAAGKPTAGLVAQPVTSLASSVLTAMLVDSLKVVAALAITSLFAAVGLTFAAVTMIEAQNDLPLNEPKKVTAAPQLRPEPAPKETVRKAHVGIAGQSNQSESQVVPEEQKPKVEASAARPREPAPAPIPTRQIPQIDHANLPSSPTAPGRSRSPVVAERSSETSLRLGRELFERVWVKDDPRSHGGDGLGPVFNGSSCVACHNLGGSGGAGTIDKNIEIVTATDGFGDYMGYSYSFSMVFGAGRFEYRLGGAPQSPSQLHPRTDSRLLTAIHAGFQISRSVVLHRYGTEPTYNAWSESVPGRHGLIAVRSSERNPPALFGAGLIDAIPDEAIEAAARRKPAGAVGVKGRVSRLKDGRLGRFGWKAQTAALQDFVLSAAAGEIGLEVPGRHQAADPRLPGLAAAGVDMNQEECNLLIDYVRSLPVPVVTEAADNKDAAQIKAGETTFKTIGCAHCHLPKLGQVEGIYSDLLLHDMGAQLADPDSYTVFAGESPRAERPDAGARTRPGTDATSAREWRTPPLWGVRDSGPYLHDGRARTIAQAITLHAGQGAAAARRFAELPPRRKEQVEAFLLSLTSPETD
jgi:RNA polymerase sigma factor (sigma-70 family)